MGRGLFFLFFLLGGQLLSAQDFVSDTLPVLSNKEVMIPKTVFVAGGSFKMGMGSLVESERPAHPVNSILTRYRFISGLNLFSEELFLHLFRHKGIEC